MAKFDMFMIKSDN